MKATDFGLRARWKLVAVLLGGIGNWHELTLFGKDHAVAPGDLIIPHNSSVLFILCLN